MKNIDKNLKLKESSSHPCKRCIGCYLSDIDGYEAKKYLERNNIKFHSICLAKFIYCQKSKKLVNFINENHIKSHPCDHEELFNSSFMNNIEME